MLQLPNGCSCSDPSVYPKNWQSGGMSLLKTPWYIQYYFHDPAFADKHKYGKLVIVKGMNKFKTLQERREATTRLLGFEIFSLQQECYNPITGTRQERTDEIKYEIDPATPFYEALKLAKEKLTCGHNTLIDIASMLTYVKCAATHLKYLNLPVGQIRRRHIKFLLEQCGKEKKKWGPTSFNNYRAYLMMLFKELVELDAVESNPVRDISKMKGIRKIRLTLNEKDRKKIDRHLRKNYFTFWRFIQIFFHSGARIIELLNVKACDVDLAGQRYKCTIKKGRQTTEVWKTIKDIALPHWKQLMKVASSQDYIFSKNLEPGATSIRRDQLTRRWEVHVKEKLGIKADLYSLKHLNTTEMVDALNNEDAAALNSHTSTAMVVNIYDVKQKDRQHNRVKGVKNAF